jgi:hypothetical protein
MGLGKKLTYPDRNDAETSPGPLYFKEVNPRSIASEVSRMKSRASPINDRLAFGSTKAQADKL